MSWKNIYYSKWIPRFFFKKYDGGKESGVIGYMLIEWKILFSIGLLRFSEGSREAFHEHAFNAITWWLKGDVSEQTRSKGISYFKDFSPSIKPKFTPRSLCHKIFAHKPTWALTFRGPWKDTWKEIRKGEEITLTHGRRIVQ